MPHAEGHAPPTLRRWADDAACAERLDLDFFSAEPAVRADCLAVCRSCRVTAACRAAAFDEEREMPAAYVLGIRGGMTAGQRVRVLAGGEAGAAAHGLRVQADDADRRILAALAAAERPMSARELLEAVNVDRGNRPELNINRVRIALSGHGGNPRLSGFVERERAPLRNEWLYRLADGVPTALQPAAAVVDDVAPRPRRRTASERIVDVLDAAEAALTALEIQRRIEADRRPGEPALSLSTIRQRLSGPQTGAVAFWPQRSERGEYGDLDVAGIGSRRLYRLPSAAAPVPRSNDERVIAALGAVDVPATVRALRRVVNDGARPGEPTLTVKNTRAALERAVAAGVAVRHDPADPTDDEVTYQPAAPEPPAEAGHT